MFKLKFSKSIYIRVFILAFADMLVMGFPFYIKYIVPNIHTFMNISEASFNSLSAMIGYFVLITQLFGGYLADRFSSKKLLGFSTIAIGLLSFYWVFITLMPKNTNKDFLYYQYLIVYIGWGICIGLFFWAPLWKLTSELVNKDQQGDIYGIQGSLVGFLGFVVMGFLGGTIFWILKQYQIKWLFQFFAIFVASLLVIIGFLSLFLLKDKKQIETSATSLKDIFLGIIKPMISFRLWLAAFFVLGMYMFQSVFSGQMNSLLSFLEKKYIGYNLTFIIIVFASFRSYGLRLLIASPFGTWAQKRKSIVLVCVISLAIGLIFATIFIFMPGFGQKWFADLSLKNKKIIFWLMYIVYFIVGIFSWFLVTLRFVQISELPVSKTNYGSAVGFISLIAFTPDGWFYHLSSAIGESRHGTNDYDITTYQIILAIALGIAIFGLVCGTILYIWNKIEVKKLNKNSFSWRQEL